MKNIIPMELHSQSKTFIMKKLKPTSMLKNKAKTFHIQENTPTIQKKAFTLRPTYTGMPMIMAGMAMPAIRAIPTGAPTRVPSCHRIFFFRLQGFFPQKVQPDGLRGKLYNNCWETNNYNISKPQL